MRSDKPYHCIVCSAKFSRKDVKLYLFFRKTKTCFDCYVKGKKEDHRTWCFGKRNKLNKLKRIVRWGYDAVNHVECREECPDRNLCPLFLTQKSTKTGKLYTKIGRIRRRARKALDEENN